MLAVALVCASFAQLPPLTSKTADEFLTQLHDEEPVYLSRVKAVAEAFVGTEYAEDPLGEGPGTRYDTDPLVDLTRVSALSYVEQCLALAAAPSLEEATKILTRIRYIGGEVDFVRRNHLLIGDWVVNNTFVRDITQEVARHTRGVMRFVDKSEHFKNHRALPLFEDYPVEGVTVYYIWLPDLPKEIQKIPDNTLIVFIGGDFWSFGSHCGLFFRGDGEDSPGMLYHASPEAERVVAVDLLTLVKPNSPHLGIMVFKIEPERMPFLVEAKRGEDQQAAVCEEPES